MKITEHNEKVLEKFATMIITRMEEMKSEQWKKGWIGKTIGGSPVNIEGRNYQGHNIFWLMLDCAMGHFNYPIYCTLRQANKLGAHVNKGAKSMPVIFWDHYAVTPTGRKLSMDVYDNMTPAEKQQCGLVPFLKSYNVFNVDQTNLGEKHPEKLDKLKSMFKVDVLTDSDGMYDNAALDELLNRQDWVCPIQFDEPADGAYYSASYDRIVIPTKAQFRSGETDEEIYTDGQEYYASLLHEMIHSTGTPERLNRTMGKRFGDGLYAKEELVAELGAARCGQVLGFDKRILDNNAAYLDNWIADFKKEPKYVLSLMGDVDKASRMILDKLTA